MKGRNGIVLFCFLALLLAALPTLAACGDDEDEVRPAVYKVEVTEGDSIVYTSLNDGPVMPARHYPTKGMTFEMHLSNKILEEDGVVYRAITVPQASFFVPTHYSDTQIQTKLTLEGDGWGKYYPSGGDVDIFSTTYEAPNIPEELLPLPEGQNWSTLCVYGDGEMDAEGSLVLRLPIHNTTSLVEDGKIIISMSVPHLVTTGTASTIIDESVKGGLAGHQIPPFTGEPMVLPKDGRSGSVSLGATPVVLNRDSLFGLLDSREGEWLGNCIVTPVEEPRR